jgi:hypothetical protein
MGMMKLGKEPMIFHEHCKSQAFLLWPGWYLAFDLIHIHFLANWRLYGACTNQHWGINQGVWSHEVDVNRWATKTAETVFYSANTLQGCLQIYNNICLKLQSQHTFFLYIGNWIPVGTASESSRLRMSDLMDYDLGAPSRPSTSRTGFCPWSFQPIHGILFVVWPCLTPRCKIYPSFLIPSLLVVGGLEHDFFCSIQLWINRSQLTFTPSCFRGVGGKPTNQRRVNIRTSKINCPNCQTWKFLGNQAWTWLDRIKPSTHEFDGDWMGYYMGIY